MRMKFFSFLSSKIFILIFIIPLCANVSSANARFLEWLFLVVIFGLRSYNYSMNDTTIINSSPLGQHLDKIAESQQVSYLVFNKKKIQIAAKITMGREQDNDIVIDSKLASRHHCIIQKIRDAYFVKDENSTNGTFLNGRRIPPDKYVKLNAGDKLTIGSANLIMG